MAFGIAEGFTKKSSWKPWISNSKVRSDSLSTVSAPLVQWVVDSRGIFTLSEGDGLAALGLSPGEVVGLSVFEIYADVPEILENTRRALGGQKVEGIVELSEMVWECRYFPIWNSDGEVSGVVGSALNVTEQMKRVLEQEILVDFARALRKATTRAEMPSVILGKLAEVVQTENTALVTRTLNSGMIVVELACGFWGIADETTISNEKQDWLINKSREIIGENIPFLDNEFKLISGERYSVAGIPLATQEVKVGVLWIGRKDSIAQDEFYLLDAIGDMIANALHRAAQHEMTDRHLQRISALHSIDQAISSSLDSRLTLSILLDHVVKQLDIDAATVYLHETQLPVLTFAEGKGFNTIGMRGDVLQLGEGLAGTVALTRTCLIIPDLSESSHPIVRTSIVGHEGFLAYYGIPLIAKGNLKGVLEIFHRKQLPEDPEWVSFLETLATQAAIAIDNAELFSEIQRSNMELNLAYMATLEGWVHALDLRDSETAGHTQRVTQKTLKLARYMGIGEEDLAHIHRGALLHDIGKIGIPDHILNKPGSLTDDEWISMRMHPTFAYELLMEIDFLRPALDIPYSHHEKWDGTGYPQGLKGDQIPLAARVFALIDVWDALSCDRPYRQAWPEENVIKHIIGQSGKHFDPNVVDAWLEVFEIKIYELE